MGPVEPPTGDAKVVDADAGIARELAYYQASESFGILAPKGWHCFYRYGSSGRTLVVAPTENVKTASATPLDGAAVVLRLDYGGTSGRFAVAMAAARLFPQEERDYIQRVIDEKMVPKEEFHFGPYPDDVMTYKTAYMVEIETPADRDGFGTSEWLKKSSDPVYTVATLLDPGEEPNLLTLKVRLPPELRYLKPAIIANFESAAK